MSMVVYYGNFPILIEFTDDKSQQIVMSPGEVPIGRDFRILQTRVNPAEMQE